MSDDWDQVHFSSEEEGVTINGIDLDSLDDEGNRHPLYDIRTLATISTSDRMQKRRPRPSAAIAELRLCVALDRVVNVLEVEPQRLHSSVRHGATVDCMAITDDSDFLLTCTRDGAVTLTYLPHGRRIFSKVIADEGGDDGKLVFATATFASTDGAKGIYEIYLCVRSMKIVRFETIRLGELKQALLDGNDDLVYETASAVVMTEINIRCAFCHPLGHSLMLTADDCCVSVVCLRSDEVKRSWLSSGETIEKVALCSDRRYCIILNSSNRILVLCTVTFEVVKSWNPPERVEQFVLVESLDSASCPESRLLIECSADGHRSVQLRRFPTFDPLYSVMAGSALHLIPTTADQECTYFLDAILSNEDDGSVQELAIKEISESLPESRLTRLLNKRKFDEALLFAKTFSLDLQLVYTTKINRLIDRLSAWREDSAGVSEEECVTLKAELYSCLDQISNVVHVVNCCIHVLLPSLADVTELLLYAQSRIRRSELPPQVALSTQVKDKLDRLSTFELLYGASEFHSLWDFFSTIDLQDEFRRHLRLGKLATATLLWQRHRGAFLREMECADAISALNELPENVPLDVLSHWLAVVFLPDILLSFPAATNDVAQWFLRRSCILEVIDHRNWPEKAWQLLTVFVDTWERLLGEDNLASATLTAEVASYQSSFLEIGQLLENLADLKELRDVHACSISLADYTQFDKVSVANALLHCIILPENVSRFVQGFLTRFVGTHALPMDAILSNFVRDLVEEEGASSSWWEMAHWEEHVLEIIKFIRDGDHYLDTVLRVASGSPVPWSDTIVRLVDESIRQEHPLVAAIISQKVRTKQKEILLKYGLEKYSLSEHTAEGLARFIIHQDRVTAMDDAAVILQPLPFSCLLDAYCARLHFLIRLDKEYSVFIDKLPLKLARPVSDRLVIFVESLTENVCSTPPLVVNRFLAAALHALGRLCAADKSTLLHSTSRFTRMLKLQNHFGLFLTGGQLDDANTCNKLFEETVHSVMLDPTFTTWKERGQPVTDTVWDGRKSGCRVRVGYHQLPCLGKLLNLPTDRMWSILFRVALKAANLNCVEWILGELSSGCVAREKGSDGVLKILENLVPELIDKATTFEPRAFKELVHQLSRLSSDIFVSCDPVLLSRITSLMGWVESLRNLFPQSARISGAVAFSGRDPPPASGPATAAFSFGDSLGIAESRREGIPKRDPYETWRFSTHFKELAVKSDPTTAAPLLGDCIRSVLEAGSTLACSTEDSSSDQEAGQCLLLLGTNVSRVVAHLRVSGQPCLALTVLKRGAMTAITVANKQGLSLDKYVCATTTLTLNLIKQLYNCALQQRRLDGPFTLALLLSLPPHLATDLLKGLQKNLDFVKWKILSLVGEKYGIIHADHHMAAHFQREHLLAEWGQRLAALHISVKGGHRNLAAYGLDLVATLACHRLVELPFLLEFCEAFSLDRMEVMMLAASTLLGATYDHDGRLLAAASTLDDASQGKTLTRALAMCADMMRLARVEGEVDETLMRAIILEADPYNYEAISFIYEALNKRSTQTAANAEVTRKGLAVLAVLKNYQRLGAPSQYELDLRSERQHMMGRPLPAVGDWLPFQPLFLEHVWEIISSEVSCNNIGIWLKLAPILELKENHLLIKTINNLVVHVDSDTFGTQPWTLNGKGKKFVGSANALLSRFVVAEEATCCACAVVDKLPSGIVKQSMINTAIHYAVGWVQTCSTKASRLKLESLQRQFKRLSVEKILHGYRLTEAAYLTLSDKPDQLVVALMHHPRTSRHLWFASESSTDIQSACTDIEICCQIDLDSVRTVLLNKWLTPRNGPAGCLDESYLEDSPPLLRDFDDQACDVLNLKRAIYFLRNGSSEDNVVYLVNLCQSGVSLRQRYRALVSLFHIIEPKNVATCLNLSVLDTFVRWLYFSAKFESLNLHCELSEGLAEGRELCLLLLRDYSHHAAAVSLAAELCMEGNLFALDIWSTILGLMVKLKLLEPLERTLLQLSDVEAITCLSQTRDAWQLLLTEDPENRDVETRDLGMRKLALLHSCPQFPDAQLLSLAEHYRSAGLPVLGLDCLLHLADAGVRHQQVELYLGIGGEALLDHLKELRSIAGSLYHLEELTRVVLAGMVSVGVETSPSWEWFLSNVIGKPELDDVLRYALRKEMWIRCGHLMQLARDGSTAPLDVSGAKLIIQNFSDVGKRSSDCDRVRSEISIDKMKVPLCA